MVNGFTRKILTTKPAKDTKIFAGKPRPSRLWSGVTGRRFGTGRHACALQMKPLVIWQPSCYQAGMNIRLILFYALCLLGAISVLADEYRPVLKAGSEVYSNVTVTIITPTDVYFTYNNGAGMANVKLKNLDPDLQKHFHYNPAKASAVEQKQAKANAEYHSQIMSQP